MRTKKIWPVNLLISLPAISVIVILSALFTIFFQSCNQEDPPRPEGPPPTITSFKVEQGGRIISQTDSSADISIFRNDQLWVSFEIDIPNGYLKTTLNGDYLLVQTTDNNLRNQEVTASMQLGNYDIHTGVPLVFEVLDRANKTTSFTINPMVEPGINPLDILVASWEKTDFDDSSGDYIWPLCIAADNSLIGVSNDILYKSVNDGNTWEKVVTPESYCGINSMVLHPSGDLYAIGYFGDCGFSFQYEIIRSTDNGDSWSILKTSLAKRLAFLSLQVSELGSLLMNVVDGSANPQSGIWRSIDGVTWSLPSRIYPYEDIWVLSYSVVNDSTTLAICGYGMGGPINIYRSINYGKTWRILPDVPTDIIFGETADGKFLSASDGKIYLATRGIFVSDNLGETWQKLSSGMPGNDIPINAMTEGADGEIYIAPLDYGVFRLEGDRWKSVGTELLSYNVVDLISVGETLYALTPPSNVFKLD